MSRGFPQDRHLSRPAGRKEDIGGKKIYIPRVQMLVQGRSRPGWLKSSGKPLNENPSGATPGALSGQPLNLVRPRNDCSDLTPIFQSRHLPQTPRTPRLNSLGGGAGRKSSGRRPLLTSRAVNDEARRYHGRMKVKENMIYKASKREGASRKRRENLQKGRSVQEAEM